MANQFNGRTLLRFAAMLAACAGLSAGAQTFVPPDAQSTCTVSPATFKSWFANHQVTANGQVVPANSVTFNHDTVNPPTTNKTINCNFYQWSQQMFLWLTSPAPAAYGGGNRVFNSAIMYDIFDDTDTDNFCMVNPQTHVSSCGNDHLAPMFSPRVNKPLHAILPGKVNHDAGAGQAGGGGALMAQGGKLVYYTMFVNDVYAFYASAMGTGEDHLNLNFPTTQTDLDKVLAWAKANHRSVPAPNALAMEMKASWVEADGLDLDQYITAMGVIPTFDTSNPAKWVQNGSRQALLAMVGMHVVGSVAGHPEMVWATYEHVSNSPNAAYSYVNKLGKTINVKTEAPKNMLFAQNGFTGTYNVENMAVVADTSPLTIAASEGGSGKVSPSDTQRLFPWGTTPQVPLFGGLSYAQANTEVISINNNIRNMLAKGDVRKNYLFHGATWTVGGFNPWTPFPDPTLPNTLNWAGTTALANSTMETYATVANLKYNCLSCHNIGGSTNALATVGVSHIYEAITPFSNSFSLAPKPLTKAAPK